MRIFALLILCLTASLIFAACGEEGDGDDEDCPSFAEYPQAYPLLGDGGSVYELYVRFKSKSVNRRLESVYAQLYFTTGQYAGVTYDLVRTEADPHRYLRTFTGDEVCENGTCSLRFKVFAEHVDGCTKALESNIFQVVIDEADDDDQ